MTLSQRMTFSVVPLLLRLMLGIAFVWSGYAKLFTSTQYEQEQVAVLVELGIVKPVAPAAPAPTEEEAPEQPPEAPAPDPDEEEAEPDDQEQQAPDEAETPRDPSSPDQTGEPEGDEPRAAMVRIAQAESTKPEAIPQAVRVKRVNSIAILLYRSANPESGPALWPSALASDAIIVALAWTAALTEFLGGLLIILGFLSRLWALGFVGTMVVAMLLTTVGPATLAGNSFLGFLPPLNFDAPGDAWTRAWQPFLLQLSLLIAALCVLLTGPGPVSVDALLFRRQSRKIERAKRELGED